MYFLTKTNVLRIFYVFLFSSLYAVIRYNVFKGVEWDQLPIYVLNKSLSLTALTLIAASYLAGKIIWRRQADLTQLVGLKKSLSFTGYLLAFLHILMSITILNASYFPKFYGGAMMNMKGESSMLAGMLAFALFSLPALVSFPGVDEKLSMERWRAIQRIGYLGILGVCLHVLIMGWSGWWEISTWPGYLPPITLLSCIIGVVPLLVFLLKIPVRLRETPQA
jgi:DMSO/TMAO reductase YedYZ heme-binding membrane subunit